MTTLSRKLVALILSDVHLGHRTTPTDNIVSRLSYAVKQHIQQIDYIFITGDFFDNILTLPNPVVPLIQSFITWLLRECKANDVRLRVLEGTPSHDWRQNYLFIQLNETIQADVRYYDRLTIDYEADFNLHCLYVPDEWSDTTLETQQQVQQLLVQHNLTQVDLSLMHGMFAFQVPNLQHLNLPLHDQSYYESITKYIILIGHDHKHKRNNRVVVPGSFDRLAHGEEADKGYLIVTLQPGGKHRAVFYPNKLATTYLSLDLNELDLKDSLTLIQETVNHIRPYSHLRLVHNPEHPIANYIKDLASKHSDINWSKPKLVAKNTTTVTLNDLKTNYTTILLNPTTLSPKLLASVADNHPHLDPNYTANLLAEVLKDV